MQDKTSCQTKPRTVNVQKKKTTQKTCTNEETVQLWLKTSKLRSKTE